MRHLPSNFLYFCWRTNSIRRNNHLTSPPSPPWHPTDRWRRPARSASRARSSPAQRGSRPGSSCPTRFSGSWPPGDASSDWKKERFCTLVLCLLFVCLFVCCLLFVCLPIVLDVVGGHGGVGDAVVDDGVHRHSDRITRQNLGEVEITAKVLRVFGFFFS